MLAKDFMDTKTGAGDSQHFIVVVERSTLLAGVQKIFTEDFFMKRGSASRPIRHARMLVL